MDSEINGYYKPAGAYGKQSPSDFIQHSEETPENKSGVYNHTHKSEQNIADDEGVILESDVISGSWNDIMAQRANTAKAQYDPKVNKALQAYKNNAQLGGKPSKSSAFRTYYSE